MLCTTLEHTTRVENSVPKPFEASYNKVQWADGRMMDLLWEIQAFTQSIPYTEATEPDPEEPDHTVYKIKLTHDIPSSTVNLAGDIIHNLRSALDNAVFDIALATGKTDPRYAAFPFANTIDEMTNSLGRCKDVPTPIHSLFCGFQPYENGNDYLWALNKLSNTDKHRVLQPFGTGVFRGFASVRSTGGYFKMPDPHRWDSAKNEMEVITFGPGTKYEYQFDFQLYVAFADVAGLAGGNAISKLTNIGTTVYRTLRAMEAECRRLGFAI